MMRIAEAAAAVGVPTHVLRHWEDEGVLRPRRSGTNQRDFAPHDVDDARIVRRLREAGVALPTIKQLRGATSSRRAEMLAAEAERLSAAAARTNSAAAYLGHVARCRHPVVDECAQCRDYARTQ